jgi:hypothetical protein
MRTVQVNGNVGTWRQNADVCAAILRSFGFVADRDGIAGVKTSADDFTIGAAIKAVGRSSSVDVMTAFAQTYRVHANEDHAAREAIIRAPRGSECLGHYATYRKGTRDRIRVSTEHGTETDVDASKAARALRDKSAAQETWFVVGNVGEHSGFVTSRYVDDSWTNENPNGWTFQGVTGSHGTIISEWTTEAAARAHLDKWLECDDERCYSHGAAA